MFDSTGLDFVREEALADGVTRVVNPMAGLVRFAVIAPQGLVRARVIARPPQHDQGGNQQHSRTHDLLLYATGGRETNPYHRDEANEPIALITEGTRVTPGDPRSNLTEAQVKSKSIEAAGRAKGKAVFATNDPGGWFPRIQ